VPSLASRAIDAIRTGKVSVPANDAIGARLVDHEPGRCVYEAAVGPHLANALGVVQGGLLASLADAAMAVAAVEVLDDEEFKTTSVTTCDMHARFLGAVSVRDTEVLRAEAEVVRHGRTLVWTECTVLADGDPVARFTSTGVKVAFRARRYAEAVTTSAPGRDGASA
jgi:uncharacterized protein (TIGR00369 family)